MLNVLCCKSLNKTGWCTTSVFVMSPGVHYVQTTNSRRIVIRRIVIRSEPRSGRQPLRVFFSITTQQMFLTNNKNYCIYQPTPKINLPITRIETDTPRDSVVK